MQSEESDELSPPPWLTTEPEKGGCFEALGLPRRLLSRRVYRGAVKKQKRYSALKLPITVDSQTAMFAYIDPGNETASGLRFWGKGNQSEAKPCHRKSTAISVDPWEASRYLSFSLHIHHATGGAGSREDVSGIDKGRDPVVPGLSRSSEGGVIRRGRRRRTALLTYRLRRRVDQRQMEFPQRQLEIPTRGIKKRAVAVL